MDNKLIWVPMENADRVDIPFELIPDGGGKMSYRLPSTLTFGHLELNGTDITGYFTPEDIEVPCEEHAPHFNEGCTQCTVAEQEYVVRPWMVAPATTETPETEEAE